MSPDSRWALIRSTVVDRLSTLYDVAPEEITDERPFADLGLTSRDAVAAAAELGGVLGKSLPATLLWDHPTLGRLRTGLDRDAASRTEEKPAARATRPADVPVAVVGIGCRLPGAAGPEEFWQLLSDGTDAVTTVPEGRWDPFTATGSAAAEVSPHGGYLDDVTGFDAEFFGIPPREAAAMDPQQRMLLEVAREALDHAAVPAPSLAGTATGVYIGISGNEYAQLTTASLEDVDAWTPPGAALSIAANRLSYTLDLRGPSIAVDTACSSSLVAVHHAVRDLAAGDSDTALAGGVNLLLSPAVTLAFQRAGALAADGRCRAFDESAGGMVRSEGCAVLVLKRLPDAERDGDRVLAVIRSTAVNSDGRSNGLLAPNAEAQRALLARAHAHGPVVDYVEAHGTGTPLGDPIEASALGAVLGRGRTPEQHLLIGSAKTNVGHLEAAAGITGLVKTVLALHKDEIPPSLHFRTPSPHIDFDALGLRVTADPEPWPRHSGTATAGVSAFGFGGTNAHAVLQEHRAPARRPDAAEATPMVLFLDSTTPDRLQEDAAALGNWLGTPAARRVRPHDLARTLAGRTGRGRFRAALVARDRDEAAGGLAALASGAPAPHVLTGDGAPTGEAPVWIFSGYGSHWPGMGHRLLAAEPAFAAAVERLEPSLRAHAGLSLRDHLHPEARLTTPDVVQPVVFGVQVALAALWRSYGAEPAAVIGHSMGEVAAAVVAGTLSADDGARVIGVRSRLLGGLKGGAMAAVELSDAQLRDMTARFPSIRTAVHASPRQSVVTGTRPDIERLLDHVGRRGGMARALPVDVAGHSAHVDPLLPELTAALEDLAPSEPTVPFYSTVHDDPRRPAVRDAAYWAANLRRPVRFAQAVTAAAEDGHRHFTEISPHPVQLHPLTETLRAAGAEVPLPGHTLRRDTDDALTFRTNLAAHLLRTHKNGRHTPALHPGGRVADVPLPRWHHRRHWTGTPAPGREPAPTEHEYGGAAEATRTGPATTLGRLHAGIAEVLGYHPRQFDPRMPLTDLGLDSLMAARIRTFVEHEFGTSVPATVLLRRGTVEDVAARLDGESGPGETARPCAARVLPRDAAERAVAHAWQHLVGGPVPGAAERLLPPDGATGPDLAVRLARSVADRTGSSVAPAPERLLEPPATVESVAALLRPHLEGEATTADAGPVRVLSPGGSRPPLFLSHPAGGSTAVYRTLTARIGEDRPCYGLERLPHLTSVAERARHCADLIRETAPEGPWLLGGWSYGGMLAQETARILAAEEGPGAVPSLVLIDTVLPLPAPGLAPLQEARRRFAAFAEYVERTYGAPLTLPYEELALLDDAGQVDLVVKELEAAVEPPPAVLEHQRTSYLDLRSGERHAPGPYDGRTLLLAAEDAAPHTVRDTRYERTDAALGWDAYCTALTVRSVPGHHLSLLDPPAVELVAARTAAFLDAPEG